MAGMTTVLTDFSTVGNTRTSTIAGHTVGKPRLVIEKRRVAANTQSVAEYSAKVVYGTEDALGEILVPKDTIEIIVRRPVAGIAADFNAALIVARDILASDDFTNSANTQNWL